MRALNAWLASSLDTLARAADRSVRYSSKHFPVLGSVGVACLLGYYFIWKAVYPSDYESFLVRAIGGALFVPWIFYGRLARRFQAWLPAYWMVTLTFALPFVFGFMLAMNAATAEHVGATNLIWPLQNVVALFLLILLVNHGPLATVLWLIATTAILACVDVLVPDPNWAELHRVYVDPMPMYAFILIVGSLSIRNRDVIETEKLAAMASVGTTIAHELRTPFLGMRALAEGIRNFLPSLIRTYELAAERGLPVERIRVSHVDGLKQSLDRICGEIDFSNAVVDMLLVNSSERPVKEWEFARFAARACIEEAVQRYPFTSDAERALVLVLPGEDFEIEAPRILVVHVIFNLLKNALYYVRKAGRGDIRISLRSSDAANEIRVEDTGTGIPPQNLKRIFERFFTTTETGHGAGIGLSFCQLVMTGVGGRIGCESELGAYTRFTMAFPRMPR
jgi:two-component system, CAI-1 autoinducer sensor kinase/phosphatase CqsS